jgi:BirA family biotin operon repressor/biotin-[acetyl-CoA-carboxylase] ligase
MDVELGHGWQRSVAAVASIYGDLDRPPLDEGALRRALVTPESMWTRIEVVAEAASTNALLSAAASEPDAAGRVLIAEHQTAGRGRLGRTWTAPPRSGLTLSAMIRPAGVDATYWPWIPLLTGLAVAAAVRHEGEVDATVKWPNDVVVGDRKLAGILVERVEAGQAGPVAVIGIGLNVSLRADELPVPTASSLTLVGAKTTDRSVLARAVLRNLEGMLRHWQGAGGRPDDGLLAAYLDACSTLGRDVRVDLPAGESLVGRAEGIDAQGRLLLRQGSVQKAIGAGDVLHLRPQA